MFQVGDPSKTAWMINDKGNKVWFKYEHTPSLFPVKETRFYKPKLHKTDFLGKEKNEDDERSMQKLAVKKKQTEKYIMKM